MATLAVDSPRIFDADPNPAFDDLPVVASDIIYDGAAVGDTSGTVRPLVSGDKFRGFCVARADNSAGAASAIRAQVRKHGIVTIAVTGASSAADIGKPVFATDDDTFTLTPSGSRIGVVARWISSTKCAVFFCAEQNQHLGVLQLADPGNAGAIPVSWGGIMRAFVDLVTGASGETRTIADPPVAGLDLTISLKTDGGGDAVVTAASDITQTSGENVATFGDAGDTINLRSIAVGSAFKWRLVGATATQQGVALT